MKKKTNKILTHFGDALCKFKFITRGVQQWSAPSKYTGSLQLVSSTTNRIGDTKYNYLVYSLYQPQECIRYSL